MCNAATGSDGPYISILNGLTVTNCVDVGLTNGVDLFLCRLGECSGLHERQFSFRQRNADMRAAYSSIGGKQQPALVGNDFESHRLGRAKC